MPHREKRKAILPFCRQRLMTFYPPANQTGKRVAGWRTGKRRAYPCRSDSHSDKGGRTLCQTTRTKATQSRQARLFPFGKPRASKETPEALQDMSLKAKRNTKRNTEKPTLGVSDLDARNGQAEPRSGRLLTRPHDSKSEHLNPHGDRDWGAK